MIDMSHVLKIIIVLSDALVACGTALDGTTDTKPTDTLLPTLTPEGLLEAVNRCVDEWDLAVRRFNDVKREVSTPWDISLTGGHVGDFGRSLMAMTDCVGDEEYARCYKSLSEISMIIEDEYGDVNLATSAAIHERTFDQLA